MSTWPGQSIWEEPMLRALALAQRAGEVGDVPVGAVVVGPDGTIVGEGANEREATGNPLAHAEVVAMRDAATALGRWRLEDCTLVVTLEPCLMCAGAALQARIPRIVLGAWDEKAGACGSVWDVVRDGRLYKQVEVIAGIEAQACADVLTDFFDDRR